MLKVISNTIRRIHPSFRPFLAGILLFACFNLLLTLVVTFSPLNRKFNFSYGNYLPTKLAMLKQLHPDKLDILFLGTSQTNNGFIPSAFEKASGHHLNVFNLGLPNNKYDIMLGCLKVQVHRYGKPRMVLLELGPSLQERDPYFFYLPALYYRTLVETDPSLAPQLLSNPLMAYNVKKELLLSVLSSLYQYRFTFSPMNLLGKVSAKLQNGMSRFLPVPPHQAIDPETGEPIPDKPVVSKEDQSFVVTDAMTERGWYPKERSPNMVTAEGVHRSTEAARKYYIGHLQGMHFEKLESIIRYCQQENIPLVLVSWPNHPGFNRVFHDSVFGPAYAMGVQRIIVQYGVPRINLNDDIPPGITEDNAGYFADPRHMTPPGALKMTKRLAQRLFALPFTKRIFDPTMSSAR